MKVGSGNSYPQAKGKGKFTQLKGKGDDYDGRTATAALFSGRAASSLSSVTSWRPRHSAVRAEHRTPLLFKITPLRKLSG